MNFRGIHFYGLSSSTKERKTQLTDFVLVVPFSDRSFRRARGAGFGVGRGGGGGAKANALV